jgi:two-component system sensor histidine kinase KdpD
VGRGRLRVYLGAAPGVGKTYTMLGEGHRRAERGTDVVVAVVETHGRRHTADMVQGLEVVPRTIVDHRGTSLSEMDVDAVLRRRPEVALVDELAHTNAPGSRNTKRWQDVEELLAAGIDVISTVNIQHLESLNDAVAAITGVVQRETLPDEVVRAADQVELVDMAPQALRRRMAHGNVYAPEKVDAALSNYFREGNLTALRELALLWLADRVDAALERYRASHDIAESWPARERVVAALTGGPEAEAVVRRAARIASRGAGGELLGLHVQRSDGLAGATPSAQQRLRDLVESLGGSYHAVVGDDVARSVLEFARGVNASQVVIGVSRRSRWRALVHEGVGERITRLSGAIDVHLVTHEHAGRGDGIARRPELLGRRRRVGGWVLALLGPAVLAGALWLTPELHDLPTELMLFLALTVAVALVGGLWPAVAAAVLGSLLVNVLFTEPTGGLTIADPENLFALVVFVVVAVAVASVVDLAAGRTSQAVRSRAESLALSELSRSVLAGDDTAPALLERMRESFAQAGAALYERDEAGAPWRQVAVAGQDPGPTPSGAQVVVRMSPSLRLGMVGRVLPATDQRVLEAFAAHAVLVLERQRLREQAREASVLREGNETRTALLAAVSHDLRTPLASIKAAVSSLRADDVLWEPDDEQALLETVADETDRLQRLIDNLLDLSRLQTGAVAPARRPVALDEVVLRALEGVPSSRVRVDVDERLPLVVTDPGLLERVVANVVENAVRHSPSQVPVTVQAAVIGDQVHLRVCDRGPGVLEADRDRMFDAFQRLGDAPAGQGVGLGLAVARGLARAVGAGLEADTTPGGGLTMTVTLPVAEAVRA